jgi:uncharacterized membrane-anchored protein
MEIEHLKRSRIILSKVPEVTIYFWIIKVLCTTVGETFSDFLNVDLGLGLTGTSVAMGILLAAILFFQFRADKYIPGIYWLTVVLISVFGTLVTDNLTDKLGVPLEVSTLVFTVALLITFIIWFAFEKTLSIHSIFTRRREAFYWLAILFTFALGTAAGDLMAERLGLGYLITGFIVLGTIASMAIAWRIGLDAVLSFWVAYIMTRPLGASLGDFLSQSVFKGGLSLGPTLTSVIFLVAILATVVFLSFTKKDIIPKPKASVAGDPKPRRVLRQVLATAAVFVIVAGTGYALRQHNLHAEAAVASSPTAPLGDVSGFRVITDDTLRLVKAGRFNDAKTRVTDLESAWDDAQARLQAMAPDKWKVVDLSIDNVLRKIRVVEPVASQCRSALESLLGTLDSLGGPKPKTERRDQ